MFFVIKDSFIFTCTLDREHVPKEHRRFTFSEEEVMDFDPDIQIGIFNRNNLEDKKLDSSSSPEVIKYELRQLLHQFKLPERRFTMAKKKAETPAADAAAAAEPKGPSKRDAVISLKVEENPKRPSSKAHERFALYKDGMTVGQFIEAGGTMADVNYDVAKGFIELSEAAE